ncbi:diaminobutyrate--2-oxoglutarate transaminase [Spirochaeta africana]|uniref:Diaminobutyrate--2-oxoglutarate transaminase n=1 Tax=Spirochaeta africana (strain ATCC 700263 / DSM 8902 / Z-7692) TaxID=889378 RepID=H9UMW8_SPIAZ|nr:diaminobutyrate--2-oxoglutarate transaminase [Spirochaeta africana]AFG38861.1 diaminobutyrate--2-oxoglutarate aminotransferase [Spirochaeta africana DSM 8902]
MSTSTQNTTDDPSQKHDATDLGIFETLESEVRSYIRNFPILFTKAKDHLMWDADGNEYVDFFSGAGALNYGHNNPDLQKKLVDYILRDGIAHSLDMATDAKKEFLEAFQDIILKPRLLDYKVMFPGPTGTNAVESALKLARKVKGRDSVISFTNAYHGMTLGSLAITGNAFKRTGAGLPLTNSVAMPYANYLNEEMDTLAYMEHFLKDNGSGVDLPAAIILETVQGEGGINVASLAWIRDLEDLCRRWDIMLIVDDVQAGCGRTGTFFSFEEAGITPDIVCISKSISGYGLPMALTLIKPEHDVFGPGEHNGTFRGNNLAFVTATETLKFWQDDSLTKKIRAQEKMIEESLGKIVQACPKLKAEHRGRGFMQGLVCHANGTAKDVCREAFSRGLIMETSGPNSEVAKLFPPITISDAGLKRGLELLEQAAAAVNDNL